MGFVPEGATTYEIRVDTEDSVSTPSGEKSLF
jgi:hypothetical protein